MKTSESITKITPALLQFQSEVKDPKRDANNPFFKSKYVTLDNLLSEVRPLLNKHGLIISQDVLNSDSRVGCSTILLHESGEWIKYSDFTVKLAKDDPQGAGSAITYARRYALSAILGVAWEDDDDGNSSSFEGQRRAQKQAPKKTTKKPSKMDQLAKEVAEIAKVKGLTGADISELVKAKGVERFNELTIVQATQVLGEIKAK